MKKFFDDTIGYGAWLFRGDLASVCTVISSLSPRYLRRYLSLRWLIRLYAHQTTLHRRLKEYKDKWL